MSIYRVIDLEKLKASENAISDAKERAIFQIGLNKYIKPFVLSEEETEAKFKEVWEDGYCAGMHHDWEEFKKTL